MRQANSTAGSTGNGQTCLRPPDQAVHVCQRATRARRGEVLPDEIEVHTPAKELAPKMRPKKVILCVDDNEQELSVLKFMLATNGYRVLSAMNGQEAIGIFAETPVDLVLADFAMPQMNGSQLVDRLKQISQHIPMILLGDPQRMGGDIHAADALLAKKNCSAQELLERIKVMSARKRGPRKGSVRVLPAAELAVAS
jgi:two-component system response regulator CpxR